MSEISKMKSLSKKYTELPHKSAVCEVSRPNKHIEFLPIANFYTQMINAEKQQR